MTGVLDDPWPDTDRALVVLQDRLALLAAQVLEDEPWSPGRSPLVGGCFVAFARGDAGPGAPGDRAWAAATTWRPPTRPVLREGDEHLRGVRPSDRPRQARDVVEQHVVEQRVPSAYRPGLLARREGPVLDAAVGGLENRPDVLLVDATGRDHPRRAGLAIHLGAAQDVPTVGVTHRGLTVVEDPPEMGDRGARVAVADPAGGGVPTAAWVRTRTGARPLLVHPGWRTDLPTAIEVVLAASTEGARAPVPLKEARRVAREARALAGAGRSGRSGVAEGRDDA